MNFFKAEIKINPSHVASMRINITARRYLGKHMRWYAELNSGFHSREPLECVDGDLTTIKKFISDCKEMHGDKNRWGFLKNETLSNLCAKHGITKTSKGLFKNGSLVMPKPRGGLRTRIESTWLFFQDLECRVV